MEKEVPEELFNKYKEFYMQLEELIWHSEDVKNYEESLKNIFSRSHLFWKEYSRLIHYLIIYISYLLGLKLVNEQLSFSKNS